MSDSTKQTILEDGTEFDGSVKSKCPITVSGKLKGEVTAPSLTITQSGAVHGQVKVAQLKSQGEIAGDIEAETVELSGRVNDQTTIRANSLEVMLNQGDNKLQVTFGNCELQVGDKAKATPEVKAAPEVAKPAAQPVPVNAGGVKPEPKPNK